MFCCEMTTYRILYPPPTCLPLLAHTTSFLGLFYSIAEHFLSRLLHLWHLQHSRSLLQPWLYTLKLHEVLPRNLTPLHSAWSPKLFLGTLVQDPVTPKLFHYECMQKLHHVHDFKFCCQLEKYPDVLSPRLQQPLNAWTTETRKFYPGPSPAECSGTLPAQPLTLQLSLHV